MAKTLWLNTQPKVRESDVAMAKPKISGLQIKNFKGIGVLQSIPIRPLTLIFGANSAGKSSILQSLVMASEASSAPNSGRSPLDVRTTQIAGPSIDLGGYDQFLHHGSGDPDVEFGLHFPLPPGFSQDRNGDVALRLAFGRRAINVNSEQFGLDGEDASVRYQTWELVVNAITIEVNRAPFIEFRLDPEAENVGPTILNYSLSSIDLESNFGSTFLATASRISSAQMRETADPINVVLLMMGLSWADAVPAHRMTNKRLSAVAERLQASIHLSSRTGARLLDFQVMDRLNRNSTISGRQRSKTKFDGACLKLLSIFIEQVLRSAKSVLSHVRYLGPLRSVPERLHLSGPSATTSIDPTLQTYWQLASNPELNRQVNDWLSELGLGYSIVAAPLVDGATLKSRLLDAIQHVREAHDGSPLAIDSGQSGDQRANTLAEKLARRVLEVGAKGDERRLWLRSIKTGQSLTMKDVGVGVSQTIPVIAELLAQGERIVAVEQPELHLHPGLQSKLGDLLIFAATKRSKTVIAETHSEHIILRVLRRIRESSEERRTNPALANPLNPQLRAEDVCILFVEPGDNGAMVRVIEVAEDGGFKSPWPGGFFEDRLEDLF